MILMEPLVVKELIQQFVPGYLPYVLLVFVKMYTINNDGVVKTYPIGLILGPVIAVGNMGMAASANYSLYSELNEYNIINKNIQKGETIYGIIGVREMGYDPIFIKRSVK
ncbi:MAG: hypothetical protein HYU69_04380 [Bacteroidetes bacterium]|nr:hypothetical protein [Bacteroidota bacterium]